MENSKKCPFCGSEINANAKKCRFCGNWIDEEIECPFCAEKIKASAKKCRYCGEWLPEKKEKKLNFKLDLKKLFNAKIKIILVVLLACGIIVAGFLAFYLYVPPCNSDVITDNLSTYLKNTVPNIGDKDVYIEKYSIKQLSKDNNGYTCTAAASIGERNVNIEYSYTKKSFKDYNIESKFILADCFQESTKEILISLIKKSKYLDVDKIADTVEIEYASTEKFEEDIPKYSCSADVIITARPGKAFTLNFWGFGSDADRKIKCRVNYASAFCENEYTQCASYNGLYDCKYKKD